MVYVYGGSTSILWTHGIHAESAGALNQVNTTTNTAAIVTTSPGQVPTVLVDGASRIQFDTGTAGINDFKKFVSVTWNSGTVYSNYAVSGATRSTNQLLNVYMWTNRTSPTLNLAGAGTPSGAAPNDVITDGYGTSGTLNLTMDGGAAGAGYSWWLNGSGYQVY